MGRLPGRGELMNIGKTIIGRQGDQSKNTRGKETSFMWVSIWRQTQKRLSCSNTRICPATAIEAVCKLLGSLLSTLWGKQLSETKGLGETYLCALGKSQETKKIKGSKKSWVFSLGLTSISQTTFICSSNFVLMVWLWTPINIFQETKRFFWNAL